jgi:hypothetical protein
MYDTKYGAFGSGGVRTADAEECRRQSEACRQLSTTALKREDKKVWMGLAEDWLKLAETADKLGSRR